MGHEIQPEGLWTRYETVKTRRREIAEEDQRLAQEESELRRQILIALGVEPTDLLSRREREVLELVKQQFSNKEIAQQLNVSERTAKWYMSKLLAKYGLRNRHELRDKAV